jgi:hypothetical protein
MSLDDLPNDWRPIRKFAEGDPNFTEPSVRHYVKNAAKFGLDDAIIRAGSRVLISPSRWYACLRAKSARQGVR